MSPGKLIYNLYYRPVAFVSRTLKTGLKRTAEINAGRSQMIKAASQLKEVCYSGAATHRVYFLTGKKYWYQTVFCLHSLQKQAGVNIHAYVVDDGTFDDELETAVKRNFPTSVTVVRSEEILGRLNEKLPDAEFPVLRRRRLDYPHLRKLTDVHILPGDGPKLVLDSDMLFFHQPNELLEWFLNPSALLFMRDVAESYGYSTELMKELTGSTILPERLNVGVAGIPSSLIRWQQLEAWTSALLGREGSSYLQEQALTAMLATHQKTQFLDEEAYKVCPSIPGASIRETLHHYVADSKYDYFVKGWKLSLTKSRS